MYSSNYEKLEIVFFYKPIDVNFHHPDLIKSGLTVRTADITNEFRETRSPHEKIKIYVITPNQFLKNILKIRKYFDVENNNAAYGFVLIDEFKITSTVVMNKKINKFRKEFRIISDIKSPYTKMQIINELLISVQHTFLDANKEIIQEDLRHAFESFTAASITAIESRDPSAKGHSERVAIMTVGLADAVNKTESGRYGLVNFSKLQREEIRYASLLHDFGKIGVREHVLQKEKKLFPHQLERIESRIHSIKDKLYLYILENYIKKLMLKNEPPDRTTLEKYKKEAAYVSHKLDNFLEIILELNEPSVVQKEFVERISEIAAMEVMIGEKGIPLLTPEEISLLSIRRGSLSAQERIEMESHVTHSYNFLAQIPWTNELKNIPEIVYGHHERLDGSGYPRKLVAEDIPLQAKMMAIADVFDALVAQDRPYKKAITYERALYILEEEVRLKKLDDELFKIFVDAKVWDLIKRSDFEFKAA